MASDAPVEVPRLRASHVRSPPRRDVPDPLNGSVDPHRVGIAGGAYGAYTPFAAVSGHTNQLGTVVGDPRVKAIVAMIPYSTPLSDAEVSKVNVPTLMISASKDTTSPAGDAQRSFRLVTGHPSVLVELQGAGHVSVTVMCALQATWTSTPPAAKNVWAVINSTHDGCGPTFMSVARTYHLINTLAVAFLERHLAGSTAYDPYLDPSWTHAQPDLKVQTKN